MTGRSGHLQLDDLVAYWLRETDDAATGTIDEHLMRCDACGGMLDEITALGEGVRAVFRCGLVGACVTPAFIERVRAQGLHVREYRLEPGGSVNCRVAPDDDLLVARLAAPLEGVHRLDVAVSYSEQPQAQRLLEDVPFDPRSGAVVLVNDIARVHAMPAQTVQLVLRAIEPGGERTLGTYTLNHERWG